MATNVIFNGVTYAVPAVGEDAWGQNVSNYLIAIASGALQKTGGTFTLTSELNFGAGFGIKSLYYGSRTASGATAGILRLANTDSISWRAAGGPTNLALLPNPGTDGLLQYNSVDLVTISAVQTLTNKTLGSGTVFSGSVVFSGTATATAFITSESNPASAGAFRLANNGNGIVWRNAANSGNIFLNVDGSNQLTYNGGAIFSSGGILTAAAFPALTGDVTSSAGSLTTAILSTVVTGKLITGYVSGAGTVSATDTILQAIQKLNGNTAAVSGAVTSVGAFGSTPSANAASIASNVLTLQPADATRPGCISITTQTLAGAKTFSGALAVTNITPTSSTTTGALIISGGVGIALGTTIGGTVSIRDGVTSGQAVIDEAAVNGVSITGTGGGTTGGGTADFPSGSTTPQGLLYVTCRSSGKTALVMVSIAGTTIISDPSSIYSNTSGTASKANVFLNSTNIRIENNATSGAQSYSIVWIRTGT